jgi:hypothetical protein
MSAIGIATERPGGLETFADSAGVHASMMVDAQDSPREIGNLGGRWVDSGMAIHLSGPAKSAGEAVGCMG